MKHGACANFTMLKGSIMSESDGISLERFKVLVERTGMSLTDEELESLKPMYDFYAERLPALHEVELGPEDLALVFSPVWDSQGQGG